MTQPGNGFDTEAAQAPYVPSEGTQMYAEAEVSQKLEQELEVQLQSEEELKTGDQQSEEDAKQVAKDLHIIGNSESEIKRLTSVPLEERLVQEMGDVTPRTMKFLRGLQRVGLPAMNWYNNRRIGTAEKVVNGYEADLRVVQAHLGTNYLDGGQASSKRQGLVQQIRQLEVDMVDLAYKVEEGQAVIDETDQKIEAIDQQISYHQKEKQKAGVRKNASEYKEQLRLQRVAQEVRGNHVARADMLRSEISEAYKKAEVLEMRKANLENRATRYKSVVDLARTSIIDARGGIDLMRQTVRDNRSLEGVAGLLEQAKSLNTTARQFNQVAALSVQHETEIVTDVYSDQNMNRQQGNPYALTDSLRAVTTTHQAEAQARGRAILDKYIK